jgi:peptidoglycan hydrolase CwlO-like protein
MVHLAVGGSPWGLAKSRYLSTRINTALEAARKTDGFVDSPLGAIMRALNKSEADKYSARIAKVDDSIRAAKEQIGALANNLGKLNQVYGNMLTAMQGR